MIRISFNGVTQRFGSRPVFDNLTGVIESGQTGVITGSNGSGKSTLLKIVAGLLTAEKGNVSFELNGRSLNAVERRCLIGMVAPDLTLYRELTGAENLTFFANLKGIEPTREMLIAALTEVGLKGRGRDLVGGYSSGMRQRLKYAFALLGRPPVMLLDEPTANLDAEGVAMVERLLAAHREQHAGQGIAIIATNEPRETAWGESLIRLEPIV